MTDIKYPKARKAKNPNTDVVFIYESGGRDVVDPFSKDSLEMLADETEGSWEIDLRNTSRRENGGYPIEEDEWGYQKDVQVYPFYYSKKGAPRGQGYPIEKLWWQKALSSFKTEVECKYQILVSKRDRL